MLIAVNLGSSRTKQGKGLRSPSYYNLELISGVAWFAADRDDIELWILDRAYSQGPPPTKVDGVIGAKSRSDMVPYDEAVPVINVNSLSIKGITQVYSDDLEVIRLAVKHLLDSNISNLCFFHLEGYENSENRKEAFIETCNKNGIYDHVLTCPVHSHYIFGDETLRRGLLALPKPAGLILSQDQYGPEVIRLCSELDISVPDDLAIVGIDNNPDFCLSSSPTLSSIDIHARQIGYTAAQTLVDIIEGKPVAPVTKIAPRELVVRQSTAPHKGLSPSVSKAVDFMRSNLASPLVMEDLVHEQAFGRRALEKAFHAEVGEAPMHYLRRLRLERVVFLLGTTDLLVSEIGNQCGFRNTNYLCRVFKKAYGTTPHAFRKKKN